MDESISMDMNMKCLFCGSEDFNIEDDKEYGSGDLLECSECNELNDYDSMLAIMKEEVAEILRSKIKRDKETTFKKPTKIML